MIWGTQSDCADYNSKLVVDGGVSTKARGCTPIVDKSREHSKGEVCSRNISPLGIVQNMNIDLEKLLVSYPAAVLVWIEERLKAGNAFRLDSEFNWLGLADSAAAYASSTSGRHSVLERILWGNVAIIIREQLASFEVGKPAALERAMSVRYNLIMDFGSYPGDPLFDANLIRDWFFRALPISLEKAATESKTWSSDPSSRSFELKWTTEWIELLRCLVTEGRLASDDDLSGWFRLMDGVRRVNPAPL